MLTQARGATPYRGVLCVSSRYCSCWKRQLGGRTFSADPALACQRSLTQVYSVILLTTRARAIRPASHRGLRKNPAENPSGSRSPDEEKWEYGATTEDISSVGVHVGAVVSARRFRSPFRGPEAGAPT